MNLRDNYKYTHISTATNTQVLTGQGSLVRITINTPAAGSISVYDAVGATTVPIAIIEASAPVQAFEYWVQVINGIYIVTAGSADITVVSSALPS